MISFHCTSVFSLWPLLGSSLPSAVVFFFVTAPAEFLCQLFLSYHTISMYLRVLWLHTAFPTPHPHSNTEVKSSAKHGRCGMKLFQSCQEFSQWDFIFLKHLLHPQLRWFFFWLLLFRQWTAMFKRLCRKGEGPPCGHAGEASATQVWETHGLGLYSNLSAHSSAEREVGSKTLMGAWFGPQRLKVYVWKTRHDTEINTSVLEESLEGKDKWGIRRKGHLFSQIINISFPSKNISHWCKKPLSQLHPFKRVNVKV